VIGVHLKREFCLILGDEMRRDEMGMQRNLWDGCMHELMRGMGN
jgi:hypothetical protein